jgi:hypothetical protein
MALHIFKDRFRNQLINRDLIFVGLLIVVGSVILLTVGKESSINYSTKYCRPTGIQSGSDSFSLYAPTSANYLVWLHLEVPMQINFNDLPGVYNPLLVAVDNQQCYMVGNNQTLALNTWAWTDQLNANPLRRFRVQLSKGIHTFAVTGVYSSIDRLELVIGNCIPAGDGSNCASLNAGAYSQAN